MYREDTENQSGVGIPDLPREVSWLKAKAGLDMRMRGIHGEDEMSGVIDTVFQTRVGEPP